MAGKGTDPSKRGYNMTSKKIMKMDEYDDSIFYRASCDCGDPQCDLNLELEKDEDSEMIYLTFYKKLHWSSYWGHNDKWYKNLLSRIKCSLKMLFTGNISVEECFIYHGKDQIKDFINALNEGMDKIK